MCNKNGELAGFFTCSDKFHITLQRLVGLDVSETHGFGGAQKRSVRHVLHVAEAGPTAAAKAR